MAVIKCKMCGGGILLSEDKTYGVCDSCGSSQTMPRVPDEQRANLFNRANHFRRANEFDKAVSAVKAAFFFVRLFVLKRGFLDGYLGFKVCSVGAKAVFKKWNG